MTLHNTIRAGIGFALTLIGSRYEGNSDPDNDLPFHCVAHTTGVIRRTEALLRAMGAAEQECQVGMLAAAFHDTVQRWEPNPTPDGRILRKRFTGQNEIDSAAEAVQWMHREGSGVFNEQDCDLVTQAIRATIPGWDVANGTVFQPNLTPDSPAVARAVALADLGIPGMEGTAYIETGDQLFREENLDITRALCRGATRVELTDAVLEGYKTRILAWCRAQVNYARGHRARLPIERGNLSGAAGAAVEALFSRFEEAITTSQEIVRVREALPAWEVVRATGYPIRG